MIISVMVILFPSQKSYEICTTANPDLNPNPNLREHINMPKIGFLTVGDDVPVTFTITNNFTTMKYLTVSEEFRPYRNADSSNVGSYDNNTVGIDANSTISFHHSFIAMFPDLWTLVVSAEGFDNSTREGLVNPCYQNFTNYYVHPSSDRDIRILADSMHNSSITSENNLNEVKNQNSTSQNTLIISSVIGIMTVIALYLTWSSSRKSTKQLESQVRELQKQNQVMEEDREITRRAWIGLGESHIHLHGYVRNGNFMNETQWDRLMPQERILGPDGVVKYYFEIKNYGQILAKHVKSRYKITTGDHPPDRHEVESKRFSSSSMIIPQQSEKQFLELTEEEQIAYQSSICYLIYEVEYESPTGKHRKFGLLSSISQNTYGIIETWDENDA